MLKCLKNAARSEITTSIMFLRELLDDADLETSLEHFNSAALSFSFQFI